MSLSKANFIINNHSYSADLTAGYDLSIHVKAGAQTVNAFYIPFAQIDAIRVGDFVGSVSAGGSANCENIQFNPHGNGTHTECVGHVSHERISMPNCLKNYFYIAKLVSLEPKTIESDRILFADALDWETIHHEALIIRTLPNTPLKLQQNHSGKNPPFLDVGFAEKLMQHNIKHLLLDLPSVDREEDAGKLAAHKTFWNYPLNPRLDATITELIFVPNHISDGDYLLNLMVSAFESDAVPSKPIIYPLL